MSYKCDQCGSEIPPMNIDDFHKSKRNPRTRISGFGVDEYIDLCENCDKQLDKTLDEAKKQAYIKFRSEKEVLL